MSEPVMTVDQAIEFARDWQKGLTVYPGATGWRIVCMVLADEVERLRQFAESIPEGCTPADARVLREANHALAAEVAQLRIDAMRTEQENSLLIAALKKEQDSVDGLNGRIVRIEQERDELRRRWDALGRYQVQSIANRICGEIPERFHIEMVLENGAGWVSLFHDGKPVEIDMADWSIAEQFDVAMQCVTEYANQIEGVDNG